MAFPRDSLRVFALRVAGYILSARARAQRAAAAGGDEPTTKPRRLLLIRPDHLGDVLLTSPALSMLRAALPEAELTLLVGPWSEEIAGRGVLVDRIITCEFPGFARRSSRNAIQPYRRVIREAERFRGQFDMAVIFRPDHWWGALMTALAGVPARLGWRTPGTRPFLTCALSPRRAHAVELNLALAYCAAQLGGGPSESGIDSVAPTQPARNEHEPVFRLTEKERSWAAAIVAEETEPLVMLHPGSGSPLKNWPPERWALVADRLVERGARVVVTGGPDDVATPKRIAAQMRSKPTLLAGETSMGQVGALAERCALVLGTDSGPVHVAASVGAPTLRIYGPSDEAVFGPFGSKRQHVVLSNQLPCRPCGNLVDPPCGASREPPCMLGVTTEQVQDTAIRLLSAEPKPATCASA